MIQQPSSRQAGKEKSRRTFLKVIGGGVIFAAGAGALYASTRTPRKALEPWKLAIGQNSEADPRRIVLSHAILAPNPHNRQPWLVDLAGENEIHLYCDLDRGLPHTDPYDRQITIGLGCFLELAELTAKEIGYRVETELFPEGEAVPRLDSRPVARMRLQKEAVSKDALFAQIFDRRSNKEPYDAARPVSAANASKIVAAAANGTRTDHVLDAETASRLREIAWTAMKTEMHTYRTAKESIDLLRIGKSEIEANPDGIDLGGVFFETVNALGLMNRDEMLDTESTTFSQQMQAMREPFDTATGFVFVATPGNSRTDQIDAGRDYVRLNLKATELGIAMQPWSQPLQEYDEVAGEFAQIREVLGIRQHETLQMFARIGYGEQIPPSPRWKYETRIRAGA